MEKKYNVKPNSFKNTFCVFKEVNPDELEGKEYSYVSKSGSSYYFTKTGMYRYSNHWGRLANSKWRLEPMVPETASKFKIGFAFWTEFYPDNAVDELYYIEADYKNNTVNYQHRKNPEYDKKAILRTSLDTAKRIKQIRNLQQLTAWARYFDNDDIDDLRQKIINQLIYTNKTLDEIKREIQDPSEAN